MDNKKVLMCEVATLYYEKNYTDIDYGIFFFEPVLSEREVQDYLCK